MLQVEAQFGEDFKARAKEHVLGVLPRVVADAFKHGHKLFTANVEEGSTALEGSGMAIVIRSNHGAEEIFGIDGDGVKVGYDFQEKVSQIHKSISAHVAEGTEISVSLDAQALGIEWALKA